MRKERPILFNGGMVRALLDGRKTQTRRILKSQPPEGCGLIEVGMFAPIVIDRKGEQQPGPDTYGAFSEDGEWGLKCPYGQPGDRLWVRESFRYFDAADECDHLDPPCGCPSTGTPIFRADHDDGDSKWKPSIHMPRWASRITLEIVSVRVERLQDISTQDILAEGVTQRFPEVNDQFTPKILFGQFLELWQDINGAESWAANPWVWAVEFKRVEVSQ